MTGDSLGTSLDDELLGRIRNVVAQGEVIETLTNKRPNRIVRVEPDGVWVETSRYAGVDSLQPSTSATAASKNRANSGSLPGLATQWPNGDS